VDIDENPSFNTAKHKPKQTSANKWYVVRSNQSLVQIWAFFVNSMTIYSLFATPLALVFHEEVGKRLASFELFTDFCFLMDIFLSFIKLPPEVEQEVN